MRRNSGWISTLPFSLNSVESDYVYSDFYETTKIGISAMLVEFEPSGVDPTGSRHIVSGSTADSFVQVVASGSGLASLDFPQFNLNSVNVGSGLGISCTHCMVFRVNSFECNTARVTDFLTPNTSKVLFRTFNNWVQNFQFFAEDISDVSKRMPESLPETQNVFRQDGARTIYQTGDSHVSQFIYAAVAASGDTPLGSCGDISDGVSGFKLRLTFDVDHLPYRD